MKTWLHQHRLALNETLRRFRRSPFASVLNVVVFAIALSLPTGFYTGLLNVQNFSQQLAGEPELSVFLDVDAKADDVNTIKTKLEQHAEINGIHFVPRDQALEELRKSAGLSDVVESLTANPLPDAFVVQVKRQTATNMETLRDEMGRWPRVAYVQVDAVWVQRLAAALKLGKAVVFLLASILSFSLVAITFNTIRLQMLTQKEEIEVAKFIGATNPFIRRPFLYHGALLGFIGGIVAWFVVAGCIVLLNHYLKELAALYPTMVYFTYPGLADTISLLLFSAWLGWLGAWLSVTKHLWRLDPVDFSEKLA